MDSIGRFRNSSFVIAMEAAASYAKAAVRQTLQETKPCDFFP